MPPQPSSPERGKRLRVSASLKWPSLRLISAWQVLYMALRGPANLLVPLNQRCYDGSDDGASGPLPHRRQRLPLPGFLRSSRSLHLDGASDECRLREIGRASCRERVFITV